MSDNRIQDPRLTKDICLRRSNVRHERSEHKGPLPVAFALSTLKVSGFILAACVMIDQTILQRLGVALAVGILIHGPAFANSEETNEAKIKRAMRAAPTMISKKAIILDVNGSVLRKAKDHNGWTCYPGVPLIPGSTDPMCNDPVWQAWITAALKGENFKTDVIGFSYMLAGDGLVNNDNPAAKANSKGVWIKEGPHLMVLLPQSALGRIPTTPTAPGPYVMWGETPMFHLMVPVAERPEGALIIHNH